MNKTQLVRLQNGEIVQVNVQPYNEPMIVHQQDYQQNYPRPRRRRSRRRQQQHPIVAFFTMLVLGFCAIGIHPAVGLLLWGLGVVALLSALLKRN